MSQANATDASPKNKFLQQPSIYKQDVEPLASDGSNFTKWKRGLMLGHSSFFDNQENYKKLLAQENNSLLYFIQITVHDELSLLIELVDKLLELRITGPATDVSQLQALFNKTFNIFSDLKKVGAGLPSLVASLILQAIAPTPASISQSQLFQNISLQLGSKKDVTARDIQTIITSAYGESIRFDSDQQHNVSVFRTFPNQSTTRNLAWSNSPQPAWNNNLPGRSSPWKGPPSQPRTQANFPNQQRQQNVGWPGHPTVNNISAAINNI
ncbi:hypothetical protein PTTG_05014 [Puccinia triticina 1-1 BBBD Race 1]|uniref:Uncharacterized protein n=1 Tax=Puccinia triticina (isolate 1-1 / race 1 (BBBD)) TaxID=630390 RepID=A0A0C4EW24_PUCT1|nr:hypothetical protein PTTG_05014 [Puccinia triticina 1-1 BBBD Race 1]